MQSVHVYAVQTHVSVFAFFLKKGFLKTFKWVTFWTIFDQICDFCLKKWVPKTASKKGAPPDSNKTLFQCQEAPGEAASRAHCTNKKQLFEQQLKHYIWDFCRKQWTELKLGVEKLTGLLNRFTKTKWVIELCWMLTTKAEIGRMCSNNCWSKCTRLVIWHVLGKGPAN